MLCNYTHMLEPGFFEVMLSINFYKVCGMQEAGHICFVLLFLQILMRSLSSVSQLHNIV